MTKLEELKEFVNNLKSEAETAHNNYTFVIPYSYVLCKIHELISKENTKSLTEAGY